MFEPGHLHLARMRLLESDIGFHIDITYRLIDQGKRVRFDVQGQINEEAIEEYFELPRETAFNFASDIDHLLRRHGALSPEFLSLSEHKEYDAMFSDIRDKLNAWHGETIDPIAQKAINRQQKTPAAQATGVYLVWRSGRDSNPRPPA